MKLCLIKKFYMILEFLVILKFEMAKLTSYFLKTEVQLMYNVLVSGIQQSDSVYTLPETDGFLCHASLLGWGSRKTEAAAGPPGL